MITGIQAPGSDIAIEGLTGIDRPGTRKTITEDSNARREIGGLFVAVGGGRLE